MKRSKISRALDKLDEKYIAEAVEEKKPISFRDRRISSSVMAVAAMLLLVIGAVYFAPLLTAAPVTPGGEALSVAIDVNPGIEISADKEGNVIELAALNADGEAIISGIDAKGKSLETAVGEIIKRLVDSGYISSSKNSVLLSVDADGGELETSLQASLSERIAALLSERSITASVITQGYDKQGEDSGDISRSKAALIKKIIASGLCHKGGAAYSFDELALLNVNELKLILDSKKIEVAGAIMAGKAASGELISLDAAIEIAVGQRTARKLETELDFEDGIMVYEVEFECDGYEYEYEINAKTGEIVEEEIEPADD